MANKKISEKIKEIKEFLSSFGWEEDRFGNLLKEINERNYRFKFNATSVRYEVLYERNENVWGELGAVKTVREWVRVRSGYYKDIQIKDGKLTGLVR